jgi:hypothetical protein
VDQKVFKHTGILQTFATKTTIGISGELILESGPLSGNPA